MTTERINRFFAEISGTNDPHDGYAAWVEEAGAHHIKEAIFDLNVDIEQVANNIAYAVDCDEHDAMKWAVENRAQLIEALKQCNH